MTVASPPAWHQALAFALTGRRFPELGRQPQPDLAAVEAFLRAQRADDPDRAEPLRRHPLPPDLAEGLGAAQLWAAVAELRHRLAGTGRPDAVAAPRPLTADERRLLKDVPPHHGV